MLKNLMKFSIILILNYAIEAKPNDTLSDEELDVHYYATDPNDNATPPNTTSNIQPAKWNKFSVLVVSSSSHGIIWICSGTLFHKEWVVTSASCISKTNATHNLFFGAHNIDPILDAYGIDSPDTNYVDHDVVMCSLEVRCLKKKLRNDKSIQVIQGYAFIHPKFYFTLKPHRNKENIALVKLDYSVLINRHVNVASLEIKLLSTLSDHCYNYGWGFTSFANSVKPNKTTNYLYEIQMKKDTYFLKSNRLRTLYNTHNKIKTFNYGAFGGALSCDSAVVAISSYVFERHNQNDSEKWQIYGIFTYLTPQRLDWINRVLSNEGFAKMKFSFKPTLMNEKPKSIQPESEKVDRKFAKIMSADLKKLVTTDEEELVSVKAPLTLALVTNKRKDNGTVGVKSGIATKWYRSVTNAYETTGLLVDDGKFVANSSGDKLYRLSKRISKILSNNSDSNVRISRSRKDRLVNLLVCFMLGVMIVY